MSPHPTTPIREKGIATPPLLDDVQDKGRGRPPGRPAQAVGPLDAAPGLLDAVGGRPRKDREHVAPPAPGSRESSGPARPAPSRSAARPTSSASMARTVPASAAVTGCS